MYFRISHKLFFSITIMFSVSFRTPNVSGQQLGPRIGAPRHSLIKRCLIRQDPLEYEKYFIQNLSWKLNCPLDDFRKELQSERLIRALAPHEKLLIANKLYEEFLGFRSKFFIQSAEEKTFTRESGFFWNPETSSGENETQSTKNLLGPIETDIEAFRVSNVGWLEDVSRLLEPLMKGLGKTITIQEFEGKIFNEEASFLWAQFLVSAGRYDKLNSELSGRLSFLINGPRFREEMVQSLFEVLERKSQGSEILKGNLTHALSFLNEIQPRNLKPIHLDFWIKLLRINGTPKSLIERNEVLSRLRQLWILFPQKNSKVSIRKLSIELGISKYFIGPSVKQMTLSEILIHADRQNRLLEGDQALITINQVLKLNRNTYTQDELWLALDLHIRLLRIMDQRHKITNVLNQYIKIGHFIDIPDSTSDQPKFFQRLYAIGRWQWSYSKTEVALATFDRIISLNRARGTDYELAASYYVRARIMEQSGDRSIARLYFEEAIQEMKNRKLNASDLFEDLMWRRFYNEFDRATSQNNYNTLLKLIDELKPFVKWDEDGERWIFWKAVTLKASGDQSTAIDYFKQAYLKTPLSYYSSISGLELINMDQKVPDWILPDAGKFWSNDAVWNEPSFSDFFNRDSLKPRSITELPWAQVYGLASIGQFKNIPRYLPELEKRAYALSGTGSKNTLNFRKRVLKNAGWLRLSSGDQLGSLRMGELARIIFQGEVEDENLAYLYPLPFKDVIFTASEKQKLNPWHSISLIRQESAFNPNARSIANALGLMQVIPPVAIEDAKKLGIVNFEPEMLLDPAMAVQIGTYHLSQLFLHFESSLIASTAGYNAGRPPVYSWLKHYSHPIPYVFIERISFAETRKYVRSIIRNYITYSRIYSKGQIDYDSLLKMPLLMPGEAIISPEDTP